MKKNNDHLYDLIHSLSTNEKRYFKLFTADSLGDKNYQKIFSAIAVEKKSEKRELKKHMSHTTMNVSYEKKYLQKILMRSLRSFHEDSSSEIALHQMLIDVEILFNKQLYDFSFALVKKSLVLAEENDQFPLLLQLLKWYRKILIRKGLYTKVAEENEYISSKERECLSKLENLNAYKNIQAQMLALIGLKGNARNEKEILEFKKIMKQPLLKKDSLALTYGAKILFFESWNWYYQHTFQIERAYKNSHSTLAFIESHPAKIKLQPQTYMAALSGLVSRCINLNKYEEAIKVIEKLERLHEIKGIHIPKSLRTEILSFAIERRLMIYGFNREFKKGIDLYEKTKEEIEKHRKSLRQTFFSMYHELIGLCFVHTKQYEKALHHLRILLDDTEDKQRSDTFLYAHLLHLITHFELKNYQLIPYLTKAVQRFAKSRGFTQETVVLFLKMFNELAKRNTKGEVTEIVIRYKPKFKALVKSYADDVIQGTIDLDYWMSEKLK